MLPEFNERLSQLIIDQLAAWMDWCNGWMSYSDANEKYIISMYMLAVDGVEM